MKQPGRTNRQSYSALAVLALLLAVPATAEAQEVRYVYGPLVLAQTLDLHSTHVALQAGAREINPLMQHPAARYPLKTLATMAMLSAAERGRKTSPRKTFWVITAITAAQFAVDWHNYRQAAHLRRTRR